MGQRLVVKIVENGETEEKALATCYYHWSGYTMSSCIITKQIIDCFEEFYEDETPSYEDHHKNNLFTAIKLLEETGAKLSIKSQEEVKNIFTDGAFEKDFTDNIDRNDGIIDITEEEMENSLYWAESSVILNLDNRSVWFDAIYLENLEEYVYENITYEWERREPSSTKEERSEFMKKISNYYRNNIITKEVKRECIKNIKDGLFLTFEDPYVLSSDADLDYIAFEDFDRFFNLMEEAYDNHSYQFVFPSDLETVVCMIE